VLSRCLGDDDGASLRHIIDQIEPFIVATEYRGTVVAHHTDDIYEFICSLCGHDLIGVSDAPVIDDDTLRYERARKHFRHSERWWKEKEDKLHHQHQHEQLYDRNDEKISPMLSTNERHINDAKESYSIKAGFQLAEVKETLAK
jgi:hypothetical protein